MIKKVIYYINEVELIPPMTTNEFIEVFCKTHGVTLDRLNEKRKNYARDGFKNSERVHISLCKFALFFFLYHRYSMRYREVAEIINPNEPVKRPTAFYYVSKSSDLLSINDNKFKEIYEQTIINLIKYANTRNKR